MPIDPASAPTAAPGDSATRWQRAAASVRDGLWEWEPLRSEGWVSEVLAHWLGVPPGATQDLEPLWRRLHPDDRAPWLAALEGLLADGRPVALDLRMQIGPVEGDAWRWATLRARSWPGADGRVHTITGTISDVHDERLAQQALSRLVDERTGRLEQALAEAEQGRRQAQAASEAQARFVAHMSHELRTPMAGLLSLVDLARRVAADPAQRRYLDVAMQSGHALQRTIDTVLDLTHARDADLPLAEEPFDLAEAVAQVLRAEMPLVRRKGLSMRYDWDGEPTWVRGDALRVRQVLANLVGNAAKFTEHGHVALRATLRPDPAAGPAGTPRLRLVLEVEDSGIGLAPEQAARVFDAFVQGDASLTRRHGGTGLGLTIARELARRMGGDITLRSTPGQGSVFTLALPFDAAPDPDPLPDPPPGRAWLLYHRQDLGQWLQRRLARLGWASELVPGVDAAVRRAADEPAGAAPALVIVAEHVMTPATDLAALRRALPRAHISLLIRPDWDQPALERQALAEQMALDIMPVTPRTLRQMALRPGGTAEPPAPLAAAGQGDVLVVEDNAINRLIAEEFLQVLGLPVRTAGDGAQALTACAKAPPRLVLMDLQMPVMDGLSATRALRDRQARGELPPFPIIALTAHAMASDAQACRDAGMAGFLTKPLMLDTLRSELARWCPELQG